MYLAISDKNIDTVWLLLLKPETATSVKKITENYFYKNFCNLYLIIQLHTLI